MQCQAVKWTREFRGFDIGVIGHTGLRRWVGWWVGVS